MFYFVGHVGHVCLGLCVRMFFPSHDLLFLRSYRNFILAAQINVDVRISYFVYLQEIEASYVFVRQAITLACVEWRNEQKKKGT